MDQCVSIGTSIVIVMAMSLRRGLQSVKQEFHQVVKRARR